MVDRIAVIARGLSKQSCAGCWLSYLSVFFPAVIPGCLGLSVEPVLFLVRWLFFSISLGFLPDSVYGVVSLCRSLTTGNLLETYCTGERLDAVA